MPYRVRQDTGRAGDAGMAALTFSAAPGAGELLRQPKCRKVRYLSQMLAENAAVLHEWDGRPGMSAYKCREAGCGDWHVGHPPGSGPRPRRRYRRRRRFGAKDAVR